TVLRVAARAAVAHAHVEPAVGAEGDHAAVVVRVRLAHAQEHARARADAAPSVRAEGDDERVAVRAGVVDVETAIARVAGVEGEPEQPLLARRGGDAVADVEERPHTPRAALEHPD